MADKILRCADCKWCEVRQYPLCLHPKVVVQIIDYFNGETVPQIPSAQAARTIGACLPAGIFFEQATALESTNTR